MAYRMTRAWRRTVNAGKAMVVVLLCVLLVSPLRNAVLFPVLPAAWRSHSSFRLATMLMDNQHFPIDAPLSPSSHAKPSPSFRVNVSDVTLFLEPTEPFQEFYKQRQILAQQAKHDSKAAEELALIDNFKPLMSRQERAQLLFTMDVFVRACREYGLTFFMIEGSLLGSYRHHGLVPWDDDIDIAVNASQWKLLRRVLDNIPGFTLYAPSDSQWKFYLSDLPVFLDKPFKWPNLDLFFFSEHDSYVWALTWGVKNHLMMYMRHLVPLSTVQWERWQLPAPACKEKMIQTNYDLDTCVTPMYIHKTNEEHFGFQTLRVQCSLLHKFYPFVFRQKNPITGQIVEILKIGSHVLKNTTVAAPLPVCSG